MSWKFSASKPWLRMVVLLCTCALTLPAWAEQAGARPRSDADCRGRRSPTPICPGGWCWQHPLPQGEDLLRLWHEGPSATWAVGFNGIALRWDGCYWRQVDLGVNEHLWDIWGSGPNDIWVIMETGGFLHWNGEAWQPVTVGENDEPTMQPLALWGAGADDIWAVGTRGSIYHWDGERWSNVESSVSTHLYRVWGFSADDIWAVGEGGTIIHWNGTSWSSISSGTVNSLMGVWGTNEDSVWSVGLSGTVLHWNGELWSPTPAGTGVHLFGIGGDSNTGMRECQEENAGAAAVVTIVQDNSGDSSPRQTSHRAATAIAPESELIR